MSDEKHVTPAKKRLFLAVNLSLPTTRKISDGIARMRDAARRKGVRVQWVPAPNLHVTLKFLGWANADVVTAIRDVVGEGVRQRKGFEVAARGVGAFPREAAARVLWVGLDDPTGGLAKLVADVEAWMDRLGFPRESRPFTPHVTIGRVKEDASAEELLAPCRQTDFGPSLVREVVLYESVTRSTGSEYTALARSPLDVAPFKAERQTREVEDGSTEEERDQHGGEPA